VERTLSVITAGQGMRRRGRAAAAAATFALVGLVGLGARTYATSTRGDAALQGGDQEQARGAVVIPFTVGPPNCDDRARLLPVTMRIYNVLAQPVGIPTLASEPGYDTPPAALVGRPINRLMLPCGRYAAVWNGRHAITGRRLAPGVYISEMVIDGIRQTRKLTLDR
jgi:hypothetical protein